MLMAEIKYDFKRNGKIVFKKGQKFTVFGVNSPNNNNGYGGSVLCVISKKIGKPTKLFENTSKIMETKTGVKINPKKEYLFLFNYDEVILC